MFGLPPRPEELTNLGVATLGHPGFDTPLNCGEGGFVDENSRVCCYSRTNEVQSYISSGQMPPSFELAGPRKKLYFDPRNTVCGILTCGGLCPGLNDVIRTITLTALWQYGSKQVLGFMYGYKGLSSHAEVGPVSLTPQNVNTIHHDGGTILGSSRGPQDPADMIRQLIKYQVNMLFVVGGDGTLTGGHKLAQEIKRQGLDISIIGIPKTIDNDIYCSHSTFGYITAVEEARKAIYAAHSEAKAAEYGIGLVKLMGRDSGFIAAGATLANSDVNFCLVPECPFEMDGPGGFLEMLDIRLKRKSHAVIVVAEGAGQYLFDNQDNMRDASGNLLHKDIGLYLKDKIDRHFKAINLPVKIKYIDPSYTIRSCPANAQDSAFCVLLGQNAVHAAMAGKTDMFVSNWNQEFINVPLSMTAGKRKKLDVNGDMLRSILTTTERVRAYSR